MAYGGYSYLDRKYEPGKDDFIALFWVEGDDPIEKLAEALAAESSIGTWTKLGTMNKRVWDLRARVFKIAKVTKKSGLVWIAYPFEHFDARNMLQFQASVLGNVFGLKELKSLIALDITFPKRFQQQYLGPGHGLEGVRKYVGTGKSRRPHIGTIVKPKVGLSPREFAKVAYEAYMGGCDFVKDDENLVNQRFCPFEDRVMEMFEVIDKVEDETGRKVLYSPNITDSYNNMLMRRDFLISQDARMAMIDVFIMGYSAMQDIVDQLRRDGFMMHAHRAGFAAESRGEFGVSYTIHQKFYRLIGVDQLHIGTGVGKMEGSPLYIKALHDLAVKDRMEDKLYVGIMKTEWDSGIAPMMPVASGGVGVGIIEPLLALHGNDVNVQAGGGIHGHPKGTRAGATAMLQAVQAAMEGIPLPKYAKTHKELAEALKKWKYVSPNSVKKLLEQEKKKAAALRRRALSKGIKYIER
ncbi:MAG: ribulose-bisphosphate carboxylase large subunit [Candidatus Micrarchaeota archaeon]